MRQAETALKDGRLDEAFELARAADVREHRRGQDLIGRLARALATRGNDHLGAGRIQQASADCDKAAALGGNLPEVAALKAAMTAAVSARQDEDRRKAAVFGAAREHIRNGELTIVGKCLEGVDDTQRGEIMRSELEVRRQEAEALLARAEEAIGREDWVTASQALVKVRELHPSNGRLVQLQSELAAGTVQRVRAALEQGRLDLAGQMLGMTGAACAGSLEYSELSSVLELCARAAAENAAGEYRKAMECLQRVRVVLPGAAWVTEALADAQHAAEAVERLRGGPLGLVARGAVEKRDAATRRGGEGAKEKTDRGREEREAETRILGRGGVKERAEGEPRGLSPRMDQVHAAGDAKFPNRWMLHVDGVGSFLVLRERMVTIGAASGSRRPDVPLLMDGSAGPVSIERMDEDWFLVAEQPVKINNVAVTRKLLSDGDRIELSKKCHIRFTVPNAACTSALLSIAGGRMPGTDANRVILLDRSLVIGPGESAHVRADRLAGPVVLHVRDGRLFCNSAAEVLVDGRAMDRQAGLPMDARVQIGAVSMVARMA